MKLRTLVWKELSQRPAAMLTSGLAIFLAVAALVAIRHITVHSEQHVAQQMTALGANLLILPKDASLQDYYGADQTNLTLPEEHVMAVKIASLPGVQRLSPKLSVPAQIGTDAVTVTGILPQSEFRQASTWQSANMFMAQSEGCKRTTCSPSELDNSPEALGRQRTIEDLQPFQLILGADVAEKTGLRPGRTADLLGKKFEVLAVLPSTGTVDDSRVFAHLHTVQELAKTGNVVNAIEVIACCDDAAGDLVAGLSKLLPDSKVVTISQVVATQVNVNRLMSNTSWFVFAILAALGSASLAGAMAANVRERRREIGTLMALGATPGLVLRLFMLKAVWLGAVGGIAGILFGVTLAVVLGPMWANVAVRPLFALNALALASAMGLTLIAAYWPARRAARLDPCLCFREV